MASPSRLDNKEYAQVFDLVAGYGVVRAAVDLLIRKPDRLDQIVLVQRDIEPDLGTWHMPGGKINGGETFEAFAARTAKRDLGIEVEVIDVVGGINFPAEKSTMVVDGMERLLTIHTMSLVLDCRAKSPEIRGSADGKNVGWFSTSPEPRHPIHILWLESRGFLKG